MKEMERKQENKREIKYIRVYFNIVAYLYFTPVWVYYAFICILCIIWYIVMLGDVDYCSSSQINWEDRLAERYAGYESSSPPPVDMSTKPVLVPYPDIASNVTENNSISSNIHELPVNNSTVNESLSDISSRGFRTSSLEVNNNSVNSNIFELNGGNHENGLNSSVNINNTSNNSNAQGPNMENGLNSSINVNNTSINSNIQELNAENSLRSSLAGQDGSNPSFNVDRYNYVNQNGADIGYTAPDHVVMPRQRIEDPSYREGIGTFEKIISSLKNLDTKFDKTKIKYYGMGKRKLYWVIWERESNRYESYKDYKKNWDPNTKVFKQIGKDIKNALNLEARDTYNVVNPNVVRGRTSHEVRNLLRERRTRGN